MSRRIPYIGQVEVTDCGVACLAMVLAYHGRFVPVDELREQIDLGGSGADAYQIIRVARRYQLHARGVRVHANSLKRLERGAILHWASGHFVVLDRLMKSGVRVVDPARGRRCLSRAEFSSSFSGVAIVMKPTKSFERLRRPVQVWPSTLVDTRSKRLLVGVALTSILVLVTPAILAILVGLLFDRRMSVTAPSVWPSFVFATLGLLLLQFLALYGRRRLVLSIQTRIETQVSQDIVEYLTNLPHQFFQKRSVTDLMNRLNSGRWSGGANSLCIMIDGFLAVLYLILLFPLNVTIAAVALLLALTQLWVFMLGGRGMDLIKESFRTESISRGEMAQLLLSIDSLKDARAERRRLDQWVGLAVDDISVTGARHRFEALVGSSARAIKLSFPIVILTGGSLKFVMGDITLGTMIALVVVATGFLQAFTSMLEEWPNVQLRQGGIESLTEVFQTLRVHQHRVEARDVKLDGGITVEGVSFQYESTSRRVLSNVSLQVSSGDKVAILGSSGSGKSTLISLLLGKNLPSAGQIFYDGTELSRLNTFSIRRQIGFVPQHPFIIGTSIRDNIALGDSEMSLERIVRAARLAHIHEDILALPLRYETMVPAGGSNLSASQRQRIALARALAHNPAILFLDEATSSLDAGLENEIYESLDMLETTRIAVAHRLGAVARSDCIIVLENGEIVEQGTHEELMRLRKAYWRFVVGDLVSLL